MWKLFVKEKIVKYLIVTKDILENVATTDILIGANSVATVPSPTKHQKMRKLKN